MLFAVGNHYKWRALSYSVVLKYAKITQGFFGVLFDMKIDAINDVFNF